MVTVMESPACTPIGSRFSMEHTMSNCPPGRVTTSISYSFQPIRDSFDRAACWLGEASRPRQVISTNSSELWCDATAGSAQVC